MWYVTICGMWHVACGMWRVVYGGSGASAKYPTLNDIFGNLRASGVSVRDSAGFDSGELTLTVQKLRDEIQQLRSQQATV